jgi:hypothetical protein
MPQYQFNDEAGFQVLPEGNHFLTVVNVTEKVSKSGNEMLVLDLECEKGKVRDFLVFSPKAAWKIDTFLKATGLAPKTKGTVIDVTPQLCLGAQGWARIEHEKDEDGKGWPRVAAWLEKKDVAQQPQSDEADNIPF